MSLRVCMASAEAAPFAKTGGLGDAVSGLTRYLAQADCDVRLFLPFYGSIATHGREFVPVDYLRDIPVQLGPHSYSFSIWTAPLAAGGPWVYFVHCPPLYDRPSIYGTRPDEPLRFALFTRAVLETCQRMGWSPQILHCHDWHAALLPLYLKTHYSWDRLFAGARTLLTIHNIGYQGAFPDPGGQATVELGLGEHANLLPEEDRRQGRINFLRIGLVHADALSTVSPRHAQEIQTAQYGAGMEDILRRRAADLIGILNGVDDDWDPATDPLIPANYSRDDLAGKLECKRILLTDLGLRYRPEIPVFGIVSRLTEQKGIDLLVEVLPKLLAERDVQLVAVGSGEARYEEFFQNLQLRFPDRAVCYRGYSNELAHRVEAGADLFLMPSLYEPCGLNQMYSLRYGTPPIVRATGGLADSVEPWQHETGEGTGFVFEHHTAAGLIWGIRSALETWPHPESWTRLVENGMVKDFSWRAQGRHYIALYQQLAAPAR